MDDARYQELLDKYLKGDCTEEERALLDQWYLSLDSEVKLPANEEEQKRLLAQNWQKLSARTTQHTPVRQHWLRTYWAAAAAVVVLLGVGWYFVDLNTIGPAQHDQFVEAKASSIEHTNTSTVPERYVLSDQSVVTLQPGSTIQYPAVFAAKKREVRLIGEAFFDIRKNPNKPFLVYSHDLITKVLGTSFRIKAYPTDRNVTVAVRTGRVSVYSPKLVSKSKSDPETIGVVLTPNQQVTYLDQEQRLVKSLVDKPVILTPEPDRMSFTFQNAPVSQIMSAIEQAYGIDVVYDEEVMANCFITTSLDQETMYDKLTIVCKLLGATYKVIDAQVVISGPGC